jgi:hypothetical protein
MPDTAFEIEPRTARSPGATKGRVMDARRFEELSRRIGGAKTRRATMAALVSGLVVPVMAALRPREAEAGLPIVGCKPPGKHCSKDHKCCSGKCARGTCACVKKGKRCWAPLEGALCCSQRCKSGKCA